MSRLSREQAIKEYIQYGHFQHVATCVEWPAKKAIESAIRVFRKAQLSEIDPETKEETFVVPVKLEDYYSEEAYNMYMEETNNSKAVNLPGRCDWTMLGMAIQRGHYEFADWIVKQGGNLQRCYSGGSALDLILSKHSKGSVKTAITWLKEKGFQDKRIDEFTAAENGKDDRIKRVMEEDTSSESNENRGEAHFSDETPSQPIKKHCTGI
jgi:hypothetical protein